MAHIIYPVSTTVAVVPYNNEQLLSHYFFQDLQATDFGWTYEPSEKDWVNPYISKQKRNYEVLNELRGPNGMDGTIDAAWKDMVQKGGVSRASIGSLFWNFPSEEDKAAHEAYEKYSRLDSQRASLAGYEYNGTVDSMHPDSQIGMLQKTIDFDVPNAFNDQDHYEKIIRTSEAQTNVQNLTDDSTEEAINSIEDSATNLSFPVSEA